MALALDIVQVNVTDLRVAWNSYVEMLRIPGPRRLVPNQSFELDPGNAPTVLVYLVERKACRYPSDTGVVLVLRTDNIRRLMKEWKAHGVTLHPPAWAASDDILDSPFGPFVAFEDPFGNIHEVIETSE